jgi:hypothetical protein
MKHRLQGYLAGILTMIVMIGGISAYANLPALTWRNINVATGGYTVMINGERFEARDRSGVIEPFNFDGWIWAPFEHIAVALGMVPSWDGDTRTLSLNNPPVPTPTPAPPTPTPVFFFDEVTAGRILLTNNERRNSVVFENSSFRIFGTNYSRGIRFDNVASPSVNNIIVGDNSIGSLTYDLRLQYINLSGTIGHIDGSARGTGGTLSFYLDDRLANEYPLTWDMMPTQISVNLTGVRMLRIEFRRDGTGSGAQFGFGNVAIQ